MRSVLPSLLFVGVFLGVSTSHSHGQAKKPAKSTQLKADLGPQNAIRLHGPTANHQLLISEEIDKRATDRTRQVKYAATPKGIVEIDDAGFVTPRGDGKAEIEARTSEGAAVRVTVEVTGIANEPAVHFENQIVPIFSRLGCNGGTCHGKTGGQNGFALSLFGFEPSEDYQHVVLENRGRRLFPASPDKSLLLLKATGSVPHQGGRRTEVDSLHYRLIKRWIEQGAPPVKRGSPEVTKIEILPGLRVLERGSEQQLAVVAHRADGSFLDVTRLAQFEPNDAEMAEVGPTGLLRVKQRPGSVAVMARYQTHVAVFQALVPLSQPVANLPKPANFIDEVVFERWKKLGLPPSAASDDATFLRRVTIDIAGRLPTVQEAKEFAASKAADRHEQLVDRLLASPDYSYYFASKWGAVLRNRRKSDKDDPKLTQNFHAWIKNSLHENKPFDKFVREVLAVSGKQTEKPQVVWYREVNKVVDQVEDVSQLFLGQRIGCARCHHHPLEKWTQEDYWGMAAFFSRVEFKEPPAVKSKDPKTAPPRPPIEVNHKAGLAALQNPKTGKNVPPTELGGQVLKIAADQDPREKLVDWMAQPDNPYFGRALVNRYWKHFFGRGLVEPEDDLRITNPPTDPALLDALANSFVQSGYDLKKLVRAICLSQVYRRSSEPNEFNVLDRQNLTRFQPRRLNAEVLLDAIDDVTGSRTAFKGAPAGTRAVQLPDNQVDSYFLSTFGRPDASSACECERSSDSNLAQALHLLNSTEVLGKISKGKLMTGIKDARSHTDRIRELYLAAFAREPKPHELQPLLAHIEKYAASPALAYEDIVWSVLNTKEFSFNH